jgi:hypothetical protein
LTEKHCFNCGENLTPTDTYCFNCGQRLDDNNLTLKAVFHEFIENYLSFDTRIGRTILPFLFQPGKLVSEFIKGKRVRFVNPFRFYLLISIFFFFILGAFVDKKVKESRLESKQAESKDNIDLSKKKPSDLVVKLEDFAALIDSLEGVDSVLVVQKMDSLIKANELDQNISYQNDTLESEVVSGAPNKSFVKFNSLDYGYNINISRLDALKKYRYDNGYSDEALLDSLQSDSLGPYERILALQTIKMYRSNSKVITRFILGNLSLSMVALIPGLALFFFLFYYKERKPFVAHLIHSLQIHTFSLFIYALAILLSYLFDINVFIWVAFVASAVYLFFSLKEVYPKSIFSTFWRYACIGILYYIYWVLIISLGIIISFLLF